MNERELEAVKTALKGDAKLGLGGLRNLRPMDPNFARRVRSFIVQGTWWDIIQLARSEMDESKLWTLMVAGLYLGADDLAFAEAANWAIGRPDIELTGVNIDYYSDWWYVDLLDTDADAKKEGSDRGVWARLEVKLGASLGDDPQEFLNRAWDFGKSLVREGRLCARETAKVKAEQDPEDKDGKTWEIQGIVFLK